MRKRLDVFCLGEHHTHTQTLQKASGHKAGQRDDKFLAGLWHFHLKNLHPIARR